MLKSVFRVLIADDDAGFRKAVGGLLQAHLPTTLLKEASSCQEMLQQLNSVDLLFLDISVAGENGLELTARLKSQHPALAVSILTIHDLAEYRQAAFQHGADYFVSKGAPAEQILEVVRSAIAGRQARSPKPALSGSSFTPASPQSL
ncbi:MAG: response regulator [Gammaproteobacteria bacterium]